MEQGVIINLNDYKRKKGIALPHSPYFTLDATDEQVRHALENAAHSLNRDDYRQYAAALVGYENIRTGKIKLLKEVVVYSSKRALETTAGIKGHYCVGLQQRVE